MPVEDEINLDKPLTEKEIAKMEREADRIERAAKKAEREAKQIQDAAKTLSDYEAAQQKSPLAAFGGAPDHSTGTGFNGLGGTLPGSGTMSKGRRVGQGTDKSAIVTEKIKELEAQVNKNTEESYEAKTARQLLEKKMQKVLQTEGKISKGIGDIIGASRNTFSFGKNKALGYLGKAGIYGAIAQFVIQMGEQVYNEALSAVKEQFKPGGIWDKRKLVLDVVTEYESIEYLTKLKSGGVFFTADAGQELRQGAPQGANNTRELRDGHLRFMQLHYNE
ncbi:MAG: hypothetical protein ACR2NW_09235 [Thermodesulfobacteriota bacterium]